MWFIYAVKFWTNGSAGLSGAFFILQVLVRSVILPDTGRFMHLGVCVSPLVQFLHVYAADTDALHNSGVAHVAELSFAESGDLDPTGNI